MLCVVAGTLVIELAAAQFRLAWTHSVERLRWEEAWSVVDGRLRLDAARVRGSGAGMEPGEGAQLQPDGAWSWRPAPLLLERLTLAHSSHAADYELCTPDGCRELAALVGPAPVVDLQPCTGRSTPP